jgi:Na+-translocating ferredoxin:NAD+ oxidoreductase RNF subunit RnfB
MVKTSLCGLGQAASNPVSSSLSYFRSEYEEHVHDHYCRAGVCKGLFQLTILPERCNGCTLCAQACASNAIQGTLKQPHTLDASLCTQCHACIEVCAKQAIISVPVPADQVLFPWREALS